jgi:hypothetical protein
MWQVVHVITCIAHELVHTAAPAALHEHSSVWVELSL